MREDLPGVGILAVVTLLLALTVGLTLAGVFGPDAGPAVSTDATGDRPTTPTAGGGAELSPNSTAGPAFTLETRNVEACGMLCRNVTSSVRNERATTAENVAIRTRLYAGNDTEGEVRWRAFEQAGTLGPGANYTVTRQVGLSVDSALAIRDAGGWVTIRTTVTSDGARVTVTDRRQVT